MEENAREPLIRKTREQKGNERKRPMNEVREAERNEGGRRKRAKWERSGNRARNGVGVISG